MDVNTLLVATSSGSSEGDYTLLILYATLALGASFLCSVLEAVLLSTSISHVKVLEQKGSRVAHLWARFKDEPERPLTAILTLNTIAHTVGALGVGAEVAAMVEGTESEALVMAVASAVLTLGILVLSEIIPKTLGALYWKNLSVFSAYTLRGLILILLPIVIPMEWMRNMFPAKSESAVTRDELAAMVEVAEDEQVIETEMEEIVTLISVLKEEISAEDTEGADKMMDEICDMLDIGEFGWEDAWGAMFYWASNCITGEGPDEEISGILCARKASFEMNCG